MRWWLAVAVALIQLQCPQKVFAKKQACVISHPNSIVVDWVWPQILVTSWVPLAHGSQPILEFKIHLKDVYGNKTQDVLLVTSHEVMMYTGRNNVNLSQNVDLGDLKNGWLNLTFEIGEKYVMKKTGSQAELFTGVVDLRQLQVQDVHISGSNVTVNCDSENLIWRILEERETVPLSRGGSGWHLSILTGGSVLPKVSLGGDHFTLGLRGKDLAINGSVPLRPFTHYHFIFECLLEETEYSSSLSDVDYSCSLKSKSKVLGELPLTSKPSVLMLEGNSAKPFYFIQKTVPLPERTRSRFTTIPSISGGGGSGGSSGSKNGKGGHGHIKIGWSGWWAVLAVILAFLLIFVIIMCFVSHYHRPKIERYLETMNLISEASQENLESSPLPERRPLLARSCSVVVDVEDPKTTAPLRLWNAVASGQVEEVEQVLATMTPDPKIMLVGWDTSPYEEAHRRGYHHILKVLDAFMSRQPQLPDNDMIISVMQSHARNVEAVFEAARGGQYRHGGGVDVLLRSFSLPGTVHDEYGQSLLHYAASVKLADGGPLWLAPDIRSLVENHYVYVNAVDYRGQTALHALAEKSSMSEQNTCWDGKAVSVRQAWVNLASLIMKLGCDSRLPDNGNRRPDEIAADNGNIPLADELEKERAELGPITYSKYFARFKEFLESSKTGNVKKMQELLKEGVSILPLGSRSDPLQEAIQGGHRDAVFQLLSAGAPLCAHGLIGDTPFEAAHNTPGLPALFPALIRRALCGQLEAEMLVIRGSSAVPEPVRKGAKEIKTIIERSGHKLSSELSKWMEQRPVDSLNNFNDMLATSASLGLTLICQLMGMAGVRLNPLPNERQPLLLALDNNQHNTVYTLCRDLKMNPYSVGVTDEDICEHLKNDLLQSELLKLEKKLQKTTLDEVMVRNLLNDANDVGKGGTIKKPSKIFLYLLAELGLVSLLHRTRRKLDDCILDSVVHEASGSTMLHIAASYGRINIVEYLLSAGADHTAKTLGGLMAPHLSAARGHKECMRYIMDYTRHHERWCGGVLPHQIYKDFEENIRNYHLDVFSTAELDVINSAKDEFTKTQLILTSRCENTGVSSEWCLWDSLIKEQKLIKELIADDFVISVECDICDFLREIMRVDSRFQGTMVSRTAVFEKTEFFVPETFEFFCELDDYHALHDGCISIGKSLKTGKEGEIIDTLKSTKDQDLFRNSNFNHAFYKAAKHALNNFTFKSMALIPPFLGHTSTGVSVYGILKKKYRINLVQVVITPVLKVPCPPDNSLRKKYQNQLQFPSHEHLANIEDNKWVYLPNLTYKSILSALTEDEQMVLWTCLFFCKLLRSCWWIPKKQQKRLGCTWQSYPTGVDFPTSRTLISHFFEELIDTKEGKWHKETYLDKVVSILKRSSPLAKRKVSFLSTEDLMASNPNSVTAVIIFLEKISQNNQKIVTETQEDSQSVGKPLRKYGTANKAISRTSLNVEVEL